MNKRYLRRTSRRLYLREQLTGYGPATDKEIPYSDQYTQLMITERNCKSTQLYLRISQTQLREAMKKHPFQ